MRTPVNRTQFADTSSDGVLWGIVERHLKAAQLECLRVMNALEGSDETLDTLAAGAERRLLAHVDGLVIGGEPVEARLLRPILVDGSSPKARRVAACLALLRQGRHEPVLAGLRSDVTHVAAAAETALALDAGHEIDALIVATLRRTRSPELTAALLRLLARRGQALPELDSYLCSTTPAVVAAAARAALHDDAGRHAFMLERLMSHEDASVRASAALSALADGSDQARVLCTTWAKQTARPHARAMLWLALVDGAAAQPVLLAQLERATHRAAALCALGYTGRCEVVPQLLATMAGGDDTCRRLAGEAFSILTGLSFDDPSFRLPTQRRAASPAFEAEDVDAGLVPAALDTLPLPNAEAAVAWWAKHEAHAPGKERVLAGKPWQLDTALDFLRRAPLRRRHAVAIWLALQTRRRVDTRAFTQVQQQQLTAVGPVVSSAATAPVAARLGR